MSRYKQVHTPGPWRVTANVLRVEELASGRLVASMPSQDQHGSRLANARLIAKAPEMYEIIEQLVEYVLDDFDDEEELKRYPDSEKVVRTARALLREIEGEGT